MDKTIFTGRQPSFLNGMTRTVDIFGTLNTYDESDNARISNAKVIDADCLAVMDDSVMSVEQFEDNLG